MNSVLQATVLMRTLAEATELTVSGDGFSVALDPSWEGWGPAGGYLAAIALRAAARVLTGKGMTQ